MLTVRIIRFCDILNGTDIDVCVVSINDKPA
jgi:hypothetical protein